MVKRFQFTAVLSFGKEGSVGMFRCPWGVAVNATDCHNHRIQIFDRNGDYLRSFCRESRKAGEFNYPRGIASHNNGNIFVANPDNHRVQGSKGGSECGQFWWERKGKERKGKETLIISSIFLEVYR